MKVKAFNKVWNLSGAILFLMHVGILFTGICGVFLLVTSLFVGWWAILMVPAGLLCFLLLIIFVENME